MRSANRQSAQKQLSSREQSIPFTPNLLLLTDIGTIILNRTYIRNYGHSVDWFCCRACVSRPTLHRLIVRIRNHSEFIVEPGKDRPADKPVKKSPYQADETAGEESMGEK